MKLDVLFHGQDHGHQNRAIRFQRGRVNLTQQELRVEVSENYKILFLSPRSFSIKPLLMQYEGLEVEILENKPRPLF